MSGILDEIHAKAGEIVTIVGFSCIGAIIYFLSKKQTTKEKIKGSLLGFFISMGFSYPLYLMMGNEKFWALALIPTVLTISGQFLPELIESTFKKYAKNVADKVTGDKDDS